MKSTLILFTLFIHVPDSFLCTLSVHVTIKQKFVFVIFYQNVIPCSAYETIFTLADLSNISLFLIYTIVLNILFLKYKNNLISQQQYNEIILSIYLSACLSVCLSIYLLNIRI